MRLVIAFLLALCIGSGVGCGTHTPVGVLTPPVVVTTPIPSPTPIPTPIPTASSTPVVVLPTAKPTPSPTPLILKDVFTDIAGWNMTGDENSTLIPGDPVFNLLTPEFLRSINVDPSPIDGIKRAFTHFYLLGDSRVPVFGFNTDIARDGVKIFIEPFASPVYGTNVTQIPDVFGTLLGSGGSLATSIATGRLSVADMRQSIIDGVGEFYTRTGIPTRIVERREDANVEIRMVDHDGEDQTLGTGEINFNIPAKQTPQGLSFIQHTGRVITIYNNVFTIKYDPAKLDPTHGPEVLSYLLKTRNRRVVCHEIGHILGMSHVGGTVEPQTVMTARQDFTIFLSTNSEPRGSLTFGNVQVFITSNSDTIGTFTDNAMRAAYFMTRKILQYS